uniref:Uncharacterized protein n=1 Tax=Vespula pensylvanica TaxID=30213 RepID=A0A834PGB3_VESPE|nr:hypothetical protein H0235_001569 [Vespula pensylvanica]
MAGWLLHKSMRASSNDKSKFHGEKQSRRRDEARHPFSAHRESLDRTVSSFMDGRLYVPTGTRVHKTSLNLGRTSLRCDRSSKTVNVCSKKKQGEQWVFVLHALNSQLLQITLPYQRYTDSMHENMKDQRYHTREVSRKNGQVAEDLTNGSRAVSSLRRTKLTNIVHYQRWRCSKSVPSLRELLEKGTINSLTWAIMTEYLDPHFIRALCRDPERRNLQSIVLIFRDLPIQKGSKIIENLRKGDLACVVRSCDPTCRSYIMDFWDSKRYVHAETLFCVDFVKLCATRDIMRIMSSISFVTTHRVCIISAPVNWQPAGTYCSQVLCLSMDPCTCPAPGKV